MRKRTLLAGLMGLMLLLAAATPSQAQISFSFGRGYYGGGPGYYGRYYGPYSYYGRSWGSPYYGYGYYPYRSGMSISVGRPYYGYPYYGYYENDFYPRTTGYYMTEVPVYRPGRAVYRAAYGPDDRRATVRVTLPTADAKVWCEDTLTKQEGRSRTFVTPELEAGGSYTYVVKATWTQDGREMTQEREVHVRPGAATTVSFEIPRPREVEPREFRGLDRLPPRDAKPKPKSDVPPPPE